MSGTSYTIVGAGAIGGTLAVHLHENGVPVQIVDADPAHVEAIRRDGLTLQTPGETIRARVPAYGLGDAPSELGATILAVKAQATERAVDWIAGRLRSDAYVASMQNGLNEPLIASRIGAERTVSAFIDLFADVISPGVIQDGGHGAMALGEFTGGISDRVRRLARDLAHWGEPVLTGNVDGFLWSKLGFGAMLTATALADDDMSALIDRHRSAMTAIAAEVFEVSDRLGISLEPFDAFDPESFQRGADPAAVQRALDRVVAWLATQTKTRSGIWRDLVVRKRPTEVPTHYGEILRRADELAIPAPTLRAVVDAIAGLERGEIEMDERLLDALDGLGSFAGASL